MVRIGGECWVIALVMNLCNIKWAHWQKESLDFSLWISPLPGEIPSIMYFLLIDFGFPLCQCEHLVSTTSEGCPYSFMIPKLARDGSNWVTWKTQTLAMLRSNKGVM